VVERILHSEEEIFEENAMETKKSKYSGSQGTNHETGEWEFGQQFSEIPYHQEPWWELMHYWISEVMWRRKFWKTKR
jgi:hypothetical protein